MGIAFGPDVTRRWCESNKVTGVFRSHEVRQGTYKFLNVALTSATPFGLSIKSDLFNVIQMDMR